MLDPERRATSAHQMIPTDPINLQVAGLMLDPGRRTTTSANQINPSDQINQQVPGRLSCDSYVTYDTRDYGNRVRKSAEYYAKFRQSWSGPVVAAAPDDDVEGEFGFNTPPVWGPTSPSASLLPHPAHRKSNNNSNLYRNLSPASKAQAIARGQRELMEMVSKMPESCYELSLKDIVEQQQQQQPIIEEKGKQEQETENGVKKKKSDKKMEIVKKKNKKKKKKNGSVSNNNEGFLLKTVYFLAFGMKFNKDKKMKKSELGPYSFKVAPRPPVVEGSDKAVDKDWWKKRFEKSESESSGSSRNDASGKSSSLSRNSSSSSLSRNSSRHESGGCLSFSFIRNKKSKNVQ